MRRRSFLKGMGAMTASASTLIRASGAIAAPAGHAIGLQLFTVMMALEKDFEATIRAVAEIGYKEVETIASFGRDPALLRSLFDKYGLVSPSQHLAPKDLYSVFLGHFSNKISMDDLIQIYLRELSAEKVESVIHEGIQRAKIMGQKYIVWPILFKEQFASRAIVDRVAKAFNVAGDLCAKEGMVFVFHNHDTEFKPIDTYVPYDLIVENTNPDTVKLELDFYWATKGGISPQAYFKKYPGRYKLCHLKDMDSKGGITDVGLGHVDFKTLIAAAEQAGIEHYFVENDNPSANPLDNARISYNNLTAFL